MQQHELIKKAVELANLSLDGKKRFSGELYVDHCLKVASILEEYNVKDPNILAVAILHHSVEVGIAKYEDIEKEFGPQVTSTLKTLNSLKIIDQIDLDEKEYIESLRKMLVSLAKDLRIVLIKLADILDNLRTLQFVPRQKQLAVAKQTLDIFAPLAERLGIGEMKGQMQDLAFPFIYPKEYQKTKKLVKTSMAKLNKKLLKVTHQLETALGEEKVPFKVSSRTKHIYSLFLKLKRPEVNFDMSKIYDLMAIRVLVETEEHCYQVLGIIHNLWRPMPNYVRDYIANPRPNGYQSIHTTVLGPDGQPFEIQIRTKKMHEMAEYGIAAHWHYDEAKTSGVSSKDLNNLKIDLPKLQWVQNLRKWQEEITDNSEFLKSVKTDFFGRRIFVLTPKGEIKDLPEGATPIDFAYSIHTDLGNKAMGAKVNSKMTALNHELKSGDIVEILASKDAHKKPSRDWLKFVVTSLAKKKIQRAYKITD